MFAWYVSSFQSDYVDVDNFVTDLDSMQITKSPIQGEQLIVVGNHAPPSRIFEGDEVTGIYFDIMRAITNKLGVKVQYIKASFDQSLKLLKRGKADVFIGPNKTPERENDFKYSKFPLLKVMKAFYSSLDSAPIRTKEDLYSRTLIVMKNANYNVDMATDSQLLKLEVTNYDTGITLALKSPDYVLVMPEIQGDYLLDAMDVDLMKSPYKIQGEDSFIVYSKEFDPIRIEAIEDAFMRVIEEGIYEKILSLY